MPSKVKNSIFLKGSVRTFFIGHLNCIKIHAFSFCLSFRAISCNHLEYILGFQGALYTVDSMADRVFMDELIVVILVILICIIYGLGNNFM